MHFTFYFFVTVFSEAVYEFKNYPIPGSKNCYNGAATCGEIGVRKICVPTDFFPEKDSGCSQESYFARDRDPPQPEVGWITGNNSYVYRRQQGYSTLCIKQWRGTPEVSFTPAFYQTKQLDNFCFIGSVYWGRKPCCSCYQGGEEKPCALIRQTDGTYELPSLSMRSSTCGGICYRIGISGSPAGHVLRRRDYPVDGPMELTAKENEEFVFCGWRKIQFSVIGEGRCKLSYSSATGFEVETGPAGSQSCVLTCALLFKRTKAPTTSPSASPSSEPTISPSVAPSSLPTPAPIGFPPTPRVVSTTSTSTSVVRRTRSPITDDDDDNVDGAQSSEGMSYVLLVAIAVAIVLLITIIIVLVLFKKRRQRNRVASSGMLSRKNSMSRSQSRSRSRGLLRQGSMRGSSVYRDSSMYNPTAAGGGYYGPAVPGGGDTLSTYAPVAAGGGVEYSTYAPAGSVDAYAVAAATDAYTAATPMSGTEESQYGYLHTHSPSMYGDASVANYASSQYGAVAASLAQYAEASQYYQPKAYANQYDVAPY